MHCNLLFCTEGIALLLVLMGIKPVALGTDTLTGGMLRLVKKGQGE